MGTEKTELEAEWEAEKLPNWTLPIGYAYLTRKYILYTYTYTFLQKKRLRNIFTKRVFLH
jgi:hypothetical protein